MRCAARPDTMPGRGCSAATATSTTSPPRPNCLAPHGTVAILDIDYHHGNGTQEFFQERSACSRARSTAIRKWSIRTSGDMRRRRAAARGRGTNLNFPCRWDRATKPTSLPLTAPRGPSGDSAHVPDRRRGIRHPVDDPIGGFSLALTFTPKSAGGSWRSALPTLICQEGGYNADALGACVCRLLNGFAEGRAA